MDDRQATNISYSYRKQYSQLGRRIAIQPRDAVCQRGVSRAPFASRQCGAWLVPAAGQAAGFILCVGKAAWFENMRCSVHLPTGQVWYLPSCSCDAGLFCAWSRTISDFALATVRTLVHRATSGYTTSRNKSGSLVVFNLHAEHAVVRAARCFASWPEAGVPWNLVSAS